MAIVPIRDIAAIGLVSDPPDYLVPPNAWTAAKNIRFLDGSVQKAKGYTSVITPSVAPYGLFPAPVPGSLFWIYTGLAKVHAFIGASDADVTRASGGDYTATDTDQWQGGTFNGIFYLNNGKDDPQIWSPPDLTTKLVQLTNWPANTKARVLRHFKNYLIMLDVSKSGTRYPRMIKWSHSAEPGTLPTSWNEADPALDAGEFTLSEGYSTVLDCLPLGDLNIIYTENEVWGQRYVGGTFVFNFFNIFREVGLLGQGCAASFMGHHFVLTQDDVIVHDGNSIRTQIDKRLRKWLFTSLASSAFYTTKVIANYIDREIWICFAQGGGTALNTALVWSWRDDTWAIRDLPDIRAAAVIPQALVGSTSTWDGLGGTWAAPTGFDSTWGDPTRSAYSQSILLASPSGLTIHKVDDALQFAGSSYESYVEHTGLSALGLEQGKIVGDMDAYKLVRGIIPHVSAADGTWLMVYLGMRDSPRGAVTWSTPYRYVVGTDFKIDCYATGRIYAVRFACDSEFKLEGYDIDIVPLGML